MVCSKDHAHIVERRFKKKAAFQVWEVLFTFCKQNSDCRVPHVVISDPKPSLTDLTRAYANVFESQELMLGQQGLIFFIPDSSPIQGLPRLVHL